MNRAAPALLLSLLAAAPLAAAADTPCADAAQAARVRELYATRPVPPPFLASMKLGVPDSVVLSALAGDDVAGTTGEAFGAVWQSLVQWDRALTLVIKAGQVFEVHGRIPAGEPSKISQNFNLAAQPAGLGGHLRPDLVGSIWAIRLEGREGPMRGVMFLDAAGASAFSVFLPEGEKPTAAEAAQFEATRKLVAGGPRACGAT